MNEELTIGRGDILVTWENDSTVYYRVVTTTHATVRVETSLDNMRTWSITNAFFTIDAVKKHLLIGTMRMAQNGETNLSNFGI